ncbi:MAG: hypoxanthine phosphoribosyltransferase [Paludibacteraceae bacterium]|nr:hypoxanthine phosphoribosyltransferase [Paludibacteraceae bacterium]
MNKEVYIKGKKFEPLFPKELLAEKIGKLASIIEDELTNTKNPLYVVMLNGAFMFAADFLRCLNGSVETKFVRYTSYSGMSSSGSINKDAQLKEVDVKGRVVVVLEDIVDTGGTMKAFVDDLLGMGADRVLIATMFARDKSYSFGDKVSMHPAMVLKDDAFIVGFGLDYDGEGRNLPDIMVHL